MILSLDTLNQRLRQIQLTVDDHAHQLVQLAFHPHLAQLNFASKTRFGQHVDPSYSASIARRILFMGGR